MSPSSLKICRQAIAVNGHGKESKGQEHQATCIFTPRCSPASRPAHLAWLFPAAAAAAKSLQSCPTLCDPRDSSPPGSPVPGILQARTLEWVAISFSNAWKWKVKVKSLSHVRLLETPWTAAYQAPLSMGFSRQEYWSGVPLPSLDCSLLLCKGKVTHSSDKPSLQCALCTLASLLCWYDCEPRVRASRAPSGCSDGPPGFAVPDAPGMCPLQILSKL